MKTKLCFLLFFLVIFNCHSFGQANGDIYIGNYESAETSNTLIVKKVGENAYSIEKHTKYNGPSRITGLFDKGALLYLGSVVFSTYDRIYYFEGEKYIKIEPPKTKGEYREKFIADSIRASDSLAMVGNSALLDKIRNNPNEVKEQLKTSNPNLYKMLFFNVTEYNKLPSKIK